MALVALAALALAGGAVYFVRTAPRSALPAAPTGRTGAEIERTRHPASPARKKEPGTKNKERSAGAGARRRTPPPPSSFLEPWEPTGFPGENENEE